MPSLSDFDHYKIETDILEDGNEVVSYEYITDAELGLRNAKFGRRWYRQADIDQGSSSNVWLELQKGDSEAKRAVKAISKRKLLEINVDYTRELKALTEFSKPKYRQKGVFVDFLGWWDSPDSVFLAMEYFPIGSLEDNISSGPPNEQVIDVMVQLLEGLEIMHAEGFAHRDLKPANIFVVQKNPKWWVKIGDFGISKRIQNQDTSLRTFTGTHDYMAPEFFGYVDGIDDERSDYTHAVDIWALGCVVYKIWTHRVPFPSHSNLRPLQRYCSGRDPFPGEALISAGCTDVDIANIKALLKPEPHERPSAKAALETRSPQTPSFPKLKKSSTRKRPPGLVLQHVIYPTPTSLSLRPPRPHVVSLSTTGISDTANGPLTGLPHSPRPFAPKSSPPSSSPRYCMYNTSKPTCILTGHSIINPHHLSIHNTRELPLTT